MTRKPLLLALAAIFFGTALLTSCQKSLNDDTLVNAEAETSFATTEDDAEAEITYGDVGDQVAGVDAEVGLGPIDLFGSANAELPGEANLNPDISTDPPNGNRCFTITVSPRDPGVFPKTVTINYGTGCLGRDGKLRKGKIITVYTKPLIVPGAQATTEFDGYYIDSVKVEGRHIIKNNSTSAVLIFTRLVLNGKLTKPNGNYIKWNAEHTQTQVAGLGTPGFPRDDEWNTTGGARGENKRGEKLASWSRQIVTPLHKAFVCRWIDKGTVRITRNDFTALLNFGDGTCDNKATITVNGVTREIKLR